MTTLLKLVNKANSLPVAVNVDNIRFMQDKPETNSTVLMFDKDHALVVDGRLDATISLLIEARIKA